MKRKYFITFLILILFLASSTCIFAHSGRTDSSGGHRDNKNVSGLGYYHYHCGGNPPHLHNGGGCPYNSYGNNYNSYGSNSNYTAIYNKPSYPSEISICEGKEEIDAGSSFDMDVEIYPKDVIYDSISWKSSDNEIATVNNYGKVTTYKPGEVVISAITENGIIATFKITVKEVLPDNIEIDFPVEEITVGDTKKLTVTITPDNTTNKDFEWIIEDEDILSIDENGNIKAKKPGKTKVFVKLANLKDSFNIEVFPDVEKVIIEDGNDIITIKKGDTYQLTVETYPQNVLNNEIYLYISDYGIIDINNDIIEALETGECTITARASNGVEESILVKVYSYDSIYIGGTITIVSLGLAVLYRKNKKSKIKFFELKDWLINTSYNDEIKIKLKEYINILKNKSGYK